MIVSATIVVNTPPVRVLGPGAANAGLTRAGLRVTFEPRLKGNTEQE